MNYDLLLAIRESRGLCGLLLALAAVSLVGRTLSGEHAVRVPQHCKRKEPCAKNIGREKPSTSHMSSYSVITYDG